MNKKVLVVALTAVALGLTACGGNGNGSSKQVSIDGSSTVIPFDGGSSRVISTGKSRRKSSRWVKWNRWWL